MTTDSPTIQIVQHNVDEDIASCRALLTLLDEEREALKSRDTDALERIIRDKANHLSSLESNAKQRTQIVQSLPGAKQVGADQKTLWLQLLAEQIPQLLEQWEELGQLFQRCQAENEINGRLLSRNKQVFNRILSIVRGQNLADNLYTAKGNKGPGGNRHSLGEA